MESFNPYLVDEIITQTEKRENYFGLIAGSDTHGGELHGFEITMSGSVVLPELRLSKEMEAKRTTLC